MMSADVWGALKPPGSQRCTKLGLRPQQACGQSGTSKRKTRYKRASHLTQKVAEVHACAHGAGQGWQVDAGTSRYVPALQTEGEGAQSIQRARRIGSRQLEGQRSVNPRSRGVQKAVKGRSKSGQRAVDVRVRPARPCRARRGGGRGSSRGSHPPQLVFTSGVEPGGQSDRGVMGEGVQA
jgi:hypothetical protein